MLPLRWIAIGVGAVALASLGFYVLNVAQDRGAQSEREAIAKQNKEAGNAGENARLDLHDCTARGLQFNYETGKCGR